MKAAVYVRVSTEDQARRGYSLNEQRESCEARAIELGAREVLFFADEGVSGGLLDRPGLDRMREFIHREKVSLLVVRDPDRLSRRLAHQLLLTEEFERFGVVLHFLDFDWQDTPDGRLFYAIRGAIAEYEKEKIRERMQRGRIQKAKQGGIPSGFNTFGYFYRSETGQVLLHPQESRVVSEIYDWFVTGDLGLNGIARRLNERGEISRRGSSWHRQVVRQIIANPVYKGCWSYKGVLIKVPVIIHESTWEKAQNKLAVSRRLWAGRPETSYLLSGIAECGCCGGSLNGALVNWWGKKVRCYTCYKNKPKGNTGCRPRIYLPAEELETCVWEKVKGWLMSGEELAREIEAAEGDQGRLLVEFNGIKERIKELDKRQESMVDALAGGLLELNQHTREKLTLLKRQRIQCDVRVEEITRLLHKVKKGLDPQLTAKRTISALNGISVIEKRAIIRLMVKKIEIKRPNGGDSEIDLVLHAFLPEEKSMKMS